MNQHEMYEAWQKRLVSKAKYAGVHTIKSPTDFWIYQEIIYEYEPHYIIEIGNYQGGMLLAYAHWMKDIARHSELGTVVYGIDINHRQLNRKVLSEPRICLFEGDAVFIRSKIDIPSGSRVIVIEDSSHTYENTLNVLNAYCDLIQPGGYFIVEDTICHHGLDVGPYPGPFEAVSDFLSKHSEFEPDYSREEYLLTWNPGGFLRRK